MAKDNRVIRSAVRMDGGEVFDAGREDELAEVLTAAQVESLTASGAIEGDWVAGKKATKETAADEGGSKSKGK